MREIGNEKEEGNHPPESPHLARISPELIETYAPHIMQLPPAEISEAYAHIVDVLDPDIRQLTNLLKTGLSTLYSVSETSAEEFQEIFAQFKRGAVCAFSLVECQAINDTGAPHGVPSNKSVQALSSGFLTELVAAYPESVDFTEAALEKLAGSGVGVAMINWLGHVNRYTRTGACTVLMAYAFEPEAK